MRSQEERAREVVLVLNEMREGARLGMEAYPKEILGWADRLEAAAFNDQPAPIPPKLGCNAYWSKNVTGFCDNCGQPQGDHIGQPRI